MEREEVKIKITAVTENYSIAFCDKKIKWLIKKNSSTKYHATCFSVL